jgi:hypothetical protein
MSAFDMIPCRAEYSHTASLATLSHSAATCGNSRLGDVTIKEGLPLQWIVPRMVTSDVGLMVRCARQLIAAFASHK